MDRPNQDLEGATMARKFPNSEWSRAPGMSSRAYGDGIVLVHGVGSQKSGDTINAIVPRIVETLINEGMRAEFARLEGQQIMHGELRIEGGRPLLVAEAHWADIVKAHRATGIRGVWLRLCFIFAALPYLLVGVMAPRVNEMSDLPSMTKGLEAHPSWRSWIHRQLDDEWNTTTFLMPSLWRMVTAYAAAIAVSWLFALSLSWGLLLVALGAAGVIAMLAVPGTVAEHVRFAAEGGVAFDEIQARVEATLTFMEGQCDRVWIIAHSQGSYVCYRLLSARHPNRSRVRKFTGVASALRPIRLAGTPKRWRALLSGWLRLISAAALGCGVIVGWQDHGFLGPLSSASLITVLSLFIVYPVGLLAAPKTPLSAMVSDFRIGWEGVPWAIAGIVLILFSWVLMRKARYSDGDIDDIPREIAWEEVSSASDLVGSMSVPELPRRVEITTLPSVRYPIVDHGLHSYFGDTGLLRLRVARSLAEASLGRKKTKAFAARVDEVARDLQKLSAQLYAFRGGLVLSAVFFIVMLPVVYGAPLVTRARPALGVGAVAVALGRVIASCRWARIAPRIVNPCSLETGLRAVSRAITPPVRRSMMLRQLVLVLLASMGAVGMACYSTAFSRVDGMSASSERLGTASVGAMSAGLLLAYGAVLMIARMRGAKGCVALALLSILSAVSIIPVGGPPLLTLESPGVQWLLVLIAGIVLQLCQRLYEPVVIAKGVSEEDKKAGGIRVR